MQGSDHLLHGHDGFVGLIVLLVLAALFAIEIGGIVLIVRCNGRLSRWARVLVGLVAVWTVLAAVVVFVQELRPGDDWWGAVVSSSFEVLYGVVACGVIFLLAAVARCVRRPRSLPT